MSSIVLPSIREMFPEYLAEDLPRSTKKNRSKQTSSSSRPSNSRPDDPLAHPIPALRHYATPMPPTLSTYSNVSVPDPRQESRIPQSFPVHGTTRSNSSIMSNSDSYIPRRRSNSDSDSLFYSCSFDILRSDPCSPSLQHIASSATFPNRALPISHHPLVTSSAEGSMPAFRVVVAPNSDALHSAARYQQSSTSSPAHHAESDRTQIDSRSGPGSSSIISFPVIGSTVIRKNHSDEMSDSDDDELSPSNSGKRHVCPTCYKRFNRPSSLKIHVNTHTGATPFRCPWPECGREFNVNSNMRRHYRNHTIPGAKAVDHRRRRRRVTTSSLVAGSAPAVRPTPMSSMGSPCISSRSGSEESDEDIPTPMDECNAVRSPLDGTSEFSKEIHYGRRSRYYSQSHIRNMRFESASGSCSGSPSLSPSPPPGHVFTPSAPYIRSFMDPRVSTALRPAFHPTSPLMERTIKEEQMTETW